jgi:hypothetical protein
MTKRKPAMNIVPAPIQEHINRVDRTRSLVIGIAAGVTALGCVQQSGVWVGPDQRYRRVVAE